jgi:hypothetical protein
MDAHKLRNDENTPVDVIVAQMKEIRPLPLGMKEFDDWAERIISGALLPPGSADPDTQYDSQKFALASMLMHLSPTTDHECDGYFIKALRKSAINQIADAKMKELKEKAKQRLAAVTASNEASNEADPA